MNTGTPTGHGGNIHLVKRKTDTAFVDFSANINPLGPPQWLRQIVSRELENIVHYPDPDCFELTHAIARQFHISSTQIIPANGTTELLYLMPRVTGCRRAIIPVPAYIDYRKVMELNDVEVITVELHYGNDFFLDCKRLREIIVDDDLILIGSPNNPTAGVVDVNDIVALAHEFPKASFLIDEAFHGFLDDMPTVAGRADNIITLNSLTKFFAIPGLRLGFATFSRDQANTMRKFLPPWTVNSIAQAVGAKLYDDADYRRQTLIFMDSLRRELFAELNSFFELKVYPSAVNYFLIKMNCGFGAEELAAKMLEHHILIRTCGNYDGLDDSYFRVAVRSKNENRMLVDALTKIFPNHNKPRRSVKKRPSLMIQGTSSNAGKSVIVAALCRILIQDGLRVAPFKAQNMSLNSFVTHEGLEMGRAQVVQAQAAKLDPDVRMNPVLLKPNSDVGSQIIVQGKPIGNMSVQQYVQYKDEAGAAAFRCYDELADEFEAIILEGAGSPGEVNLKHHDIVNMNMAQYAESPVLLVGDIDRGGVYASFIGTMEVLHEWERNLVAGFLVNRFRGDATLLQSAHDYVFDHTGRNVLGTIPFIKELGIPEEDSVSFKEGRLQKKRPDCDHIEIALINLPHISNFTDIEPFLDEPDVHLQIVDSVHELAEPHCIIIPGSKNVIGDLRYLQRSGIGEAIAARANTNCEIVGICGGYQILGRSIGDPFGIESEVTSTAALSLLDLETTLASEKTLVRRIGTHRLSGMPIYGYEIHHGQSTSALDPVLVFDDDDYCGTQNSCGDIWGMYLHGIFDADLFRRWFIDRLRQKAGLVPLKKIVAPYDLEMAFDNLANHVRDSIDMEKIYQLLDR